MSKNINEAIEEGMVWFSGNTIALKLVGMFTVFLILHKLSVYEYGLVELVLSVVSLLSIFLLPNLNTVVIADMGVEKGKGNLAQAKTIFDSFVGVQMVSASVAWAITFFGATLLAPYYGNASTLIQITSFLFLITPLRTSLNVLFSVELNFLQQSLYSFMEEAAKLVLIIIFFFVFNLKTEGVILSSVTSQFIVFLLFLPFSFSVYRSFGREGNGGWRSALALISSHGKWTIFSTYVANFNQNIRIWIVKFFLGTEAVGLFALAQGLIGQVSSLLPINRVVAPIIPQYLENKERLFHLLNKSIKYQLIGNILIGILSLIGMPILVMFFFSKYLPAMDLFRVMLLSLFSFSFDSIFTSVFFALKVQKNLFFATVYKIVLTVILMPPLIYFFGIWGVAYTFVLAAFFYTFERYRKVLKLLPGFTFTFRDFISIDDYDKLILNRLWQKTLLFRRTS